MLSVNPAKDTHERLPSRLDPEAGQERSKPTRFVRILMRLLIPSPSEACKQISGTTLRRSTHGRFAPNSDAADAECRLRPVFAFVQIGLEQRLHFFESILHKSSNRLGIPPPCDRCAVAPHGAKGPPEKFCHAPS